MSGVDLPSGTEFYPITGHLSGIVTKIEATRRRVLVESGPTRGGEAALYWVSFPRQAEVWVEGHGGLAKSSFRALRVGARVDVETDGAMGMTQPATATARKITVRSPEFPQS